MFNPDPPSKPVLNRTLEGKDAGGNAVKVEEFTDIVGAFCKVNGKKASRSDVQRAIASIVPQYAEALSVS